MPLPCRKEELLQTLRREGLDQTFQRIEELYQTDLGLSGSSCHDIGHDIGLASYRLYLQGKDSVLSPRASYCAFGFYHGFMEALLGASRDIGQARQFCLDVKEKLTALAPDSYLQCFHGIGHGAVEYTLGGGLRPSGDEMILLRPALDFCEEASETSEEIYRCASGAFNGLANFYIDGRYGLKAKEEDPLWFCRLQPEKYLESCYGNMSSYLLWQTEKDFKEALKFVRVLDGGHAKKATWYLASLTAASNLLSFNQDEIEKVISACRELDQSLKVVCIQGLTQGFLEHGTPSIEYLGMIKFCGLDQLTSEEREICFSYALGGLQGWYSQEKGTEICRGLEASIRKYCHKSLL